MSRQATTQPGPWGLPPARPPSLPPWGQARPVPDLQQRQQQPVEPPPLQQAQLRAGAAQLAQEHQQRHLVGGDPVLDAEDVGMHHAVRHHRVEVEALVHARHGGNPPPPAAPPTAPSPGQLPSPAGQSPPPPPSCGPRRGQSEAELCAATAGPAGGPSPGQTFRGEKDRAGPAGGKRASGGGGRAGWPSVLHRAGSPPSCHGSPSARLWSVASYSQRLCGLATHSPVA